MKNYLEVTKEDVLQNLKGSVKSARGVSLCLTDDTSPVAVRHVAEILEGLVRAGRVTRASKCDVFFFQLSNKKADRLPGVTP